MKLNRIIRFRASEEVEQRVIEMAAKVGCTVSDVLRQLVCSAVLEPGTTYHPISKLPKQLARPQIPNDAGVRQD